MIVDQSIVTVYTDIMSFVLAMGLLFLFKRYHRWRDKTGDKLFTALCALTMFKAFTNAVSFALHYQHTGWPLPLRLLFPTLAELSVLLGMFVWFLYVDYSIYESWDHVRDIQKHFGIPVLICVGLFVHNYFTRAFFTVDESMLFQPKPLFTLIVVIQYSYGVLSILAVVRYVIRHGRIRFFSIMPVLVPVIAACLFTIFTPYSARAFGFALALVFIHFSGMNKWRFHDSESGFYNRQYLVSLMDLIRTGKRNYQGALCLKAKSPSQEFYGILRMELPKDAELICKERGNYILFTENAQLSSLEFISSVVSEAVEGAEEREEIAPVGFSVQIEKRQETENPMEFVKRMM